MATTGFLLLLLATAACTAKFPSNWKKCPKTDNEECLKDAVEKAVHDMKDGKRELNVVPLDPLHFTKMELNQGGSSPVNINLTFYDLDLVGSSRAVLRSIKADWDNYVVELDAAVEAGPAFLKGDYTIDGKVLVLPIKGKGKANIKIENLTALVTLKGREQVKNKKKYFKVDSSNFILGTSNVHFAFENLFNGDKALGDNVNTFLNENWKEIIGELNGTISQALGLGIQQVAAGLFNTIPVTELYT